MIRPFIYGKCPAGDVNASIIEASQVRRIGGGGDDAKAQTDRGGSSGFLTYSSTLLVVPPPAPLHVGGF